MIWPWRDCVGCELTSLTHGDYAFQKGVAGEATSLTHGDYAFQRGVAGEATSLTKGDCAFQIRGGWRGHESHLWRLCFPFWWRARPRVSILETALSSFYLLFTYFYLILITFTYFLLTYVLTPVHLSYRLCLLTCFCYCLFISFLFYLFFKTLVVFIATFISHG